MLLPGLGVSYEIFLPLIGLLQEDFHIIAVEVDGSCSSLQRVLEYGRYDDWKLILSYYGINRISGTAVNLRSLEPRAMSFISAIANIPKEQFRCYTLRQSSQNTGTIKETSGIA